MTEVVRDREIKILEFDRIRQELAALAVSPMAAEMANCLVPYADFKQIAKLQQETAEGKLLRRRNAFSPAAVEDIEPLVSRACKGAILSGQDVAAVHHFMKASSRWLKFFSDSEQVALYPQMADLAGLIVSCHEAGAEMSRSIDSEGKVLDSASEQLQSLRRQGQALQNRIREKLDNYIRGSSTRKYLQEPLVTIRGDRFVLPVKQEYRQQMEGIVHDQSASGATLFIEPAPVVHMQNELAGVKRLEEQEIERILYKLSSIIADLSGELLQNRTLYGELDFILSRGGYSLNNGCNEPELLSEEVSKINLHKARHPFIEGEKVPLSAEWGDPIRTLVITGPNTGGKTVALKTIGLMAVMVQSGLQIPAEMGTRMSVFNLIRVDIGDEQSIAQSLSTFSGHMKNIIEIMSESGSQTLVLLDELGAGTDPSEGSALAMAILEYLTDRGSMTVATTHINELKLFAQVRRQMQNAAMEFDPHTLTPTYRLLQGIPGQSNAFYIAGKLGLPPDVMEKAKNFVHRSHDQVESVIASLVEDQQRYHRDSHQAALERSRAEQLMIDLEKERELLRSRRDDILKEAREEARELIKKTKNSTDQLIRELKSIKNSSEEKPAARIEEIRRNLNTVKEDIGYDEEEQFEGEAPQELDLREGDPVYVCSLRQRGEVVAVNNEEAQVRVGMMKVFLPLSDLRIEHNKNNRKLQSEKAAAGGYSISKDLSISSSIDLRGLNLDEAQPLVDKLLDNALWAGLNRVDIIHGKGTGKLKKGLRSYLKEHNLVKSMRTGNPAEGGDGVTVIEINS